MARGSVKAENQDQKTTLKKTRTKSAAAEKKQTGTRTRSKKEPGIKAKSEIITEKKN